MPHGRRTDATDMTHRLTAVTAALALLVTAVVMVEDLSLQMSAEEALAREISARGPVGVASYRIVPREDLKDKDKAKGWLERAGVQGLVSMKIVDTDKQKVYSSVVWSSGY